MRVSALQFTLVRGLFASLIALALLPSPARAQFIRFDQPTDAVHLFENTVLTTTVTYECQIYFSSSFQGQGFVFNEWTLAAEDKWFAIGPNHISGFSFPAGGSGHFSTNPSISLNQWHHVAYVHDGLFDFLYLDGSIVGSRSATGLIGNASGLTTLGAIFRDGGIADSFLGYLDSFRMSSIARYSGASFTPPEGDMTTDANTLMLFNFNETAGSTFLNDLSGNGHNGILGSGFAGATSPEFVTAVPEPSAWAMIVSILAVVGVCRLTSIPKLLSIR